eukprot:gene601-7876_t
MNENTSSQRLFQLLDVNHSGFIEQDELDQFLQLVGVTDKRSRQQQVPVLLQKMDLDGDGRISFEEFTSVAKSMNLNFESTLRAAEHKAGDEQKANHIRTSFLTPIQAMSLFEELNTHDTGSINAEDIAQLLSERCNIKDKKEQDKVLREQFGVSREGSITQDEFLHLEIHDSIGHQLLRAASPDSMSSISTFGISNGRMPPTNSRERLRKLFQSAGRGIAETLLCLVFQLCGISSHVASPGKLTRLRAVIVGTDHNGKIAVEASLMRKYGLHFLPEDSSAIKKSLYELNVSDGGLDFDEFCVVFASVIEDDNHAATIFCELARDLLQRNKILQKKLQSERKRAADLRQSMETRVSAENMTLLEANEAELRQALEKTDNLERSNRNIEAQNIELKQTLTEHVKEGSADATIFSGAVAGKLSQPYFLEKKLKDLQENNDILERALSDTLKDKDELEDNSKFEINQLKQQIQHLKLEKEHLEVALAEITRARQTHSTTNGDNALADDFSKLQRELASQKALAFDLTNERDALAKENELLKRASSSDTTTAPTTSSSKEEIEVLNARLYASMQEIRDLHAENENLRSFFPETSDIDGNKHATLQERLDLEADRARLEEEKRHIADLKREMEALQAMVVAQTAELAMRQEPLAELDQLRSEVAMQRQLTADAQKRSSLAHQRSDESSRTDTAYNQLVPSSKESNDDLGAVGLPYLRIVPKLHAENKSLKRMLKALHDAYKKKSGHNDPSKCKEELQAACKEIARLTIEIDSLRAQLPSTATDAFTVQQLQIKDERIKELETMLKSSEERTKNMMDAMRGLKDQTRVQVEVRKETIHTRAKRSGERVPVDHKQEVSVVTYYTDSQHPNLSTSPWTETEDRILLQAQLQLGGDWVEIAKLLPGRSDEDIAHRWSLLSDSLISKSGQSRTFPEDKQQLAQQPKKQQQLSAANNEEVFSLARQASVMSRRSEGVYDLAAVEDRERNVSFDMSACGLVPNEHYSDTLAVFLIQ